MQNDSENSARTPDPAQQDTDPAVADRRRPAGKPAPRGLGEGLPAEAGEDPPERPRA
jgi:hypothetical protein